MLVYKLFDEKNIIVFMVIQTTVSISTNFRHRIFIKIHHQFQILKTGLQMEIIDNNMYVLNVQYEGLGTNRKNNQEYLSVVLVRLYSQDFH